MSRDYKVGYGKAPKATRFKPGKSGNPSGRPKGSKNLKTDIEDVLAETIPIKERARFVDKNTKLFDEVKFLAAYEKALPGAVPLVTLARTAPGLRATASP